MPRATTRVGDHEDSRPPPGRQRHEDRDLVLVAPVVLAPAPQRLRLGLRDPRHLEEQHEQEDGNEDRHPAVRRRRTRSRPTRPSAATRRSSSDGATSPRGRCGPSCPCWRGRPSRRRAACRRSSRRRSTRARAPRPTHASHVISPVIGGDEGERAARRRRRTLPAPGRRRRTSGSRAAPSAAAAPGSARPPPCRRAGRGGTCPSRTPQIVPRPATSTRCSVEPSGEQRVGDRRARDPERPGDVDVARVRDPDRHEPDADHRQARADGADEQQEPGRGDHLVTVFAPSAEDHQARISGRLRPQAASTPGASRVSAASAVSLAFV